MKKLRRNSKHTRVKSTNRANSNRSEQELPDTLGYIIDSGLHSIEVQLKSLKRLTRPLQDATPDAREEVEAVASLIAEARRYFGTTEASERYHVDRKYAGRRALEESEACCGTLRGV